MVVASLQVTDRLQMLNHPPSVTEILPSLKDWNSERLKFSQVTLLKLRKYIFSQSWYKICVQTVIRPSHLILQHHHRHFNQFPAFAAVPSISFHFQPVLAISSHFQPFPVNPAISSYSQPVLAISNHVQLYSAYGNSNHIHTFPATSSYFQPFPVFPRHPIHFQSFPAISKHFQPCYHSSHFQHFPAISSHVQPFPAIRVVSSHTGRFQPFQPCPASSSHFQPFSAIFSQF